MTEVKSCPRFGKVTNDAAAKNYNEYYAVLILKEMGSVKMERGSLFSRPKAMRPKKDLTMTEVKAYPRFAIAKNYIKKMEVTKECLRLRKEASTRRPQILEPDSNRHCNHSFRC
jgi:hypothetical protein